MHSWDKREAASLKALLSFSEVPYSSVDAGPLTNHPAEATRGWKSVRPCAEYNCTAKASKKRTTKYPAAPHRFRTQNQEADFAYMTGRLDENFSYTYPRGGRASTTKYGALYNPQYPGTQPTYHRRLLSLNPVVPFRSAQLEPDAQTGLAAIMAMQMKPELLVEQIIIENRLRTMSLNAFPILGIGPVVDSDPHKKLPPKSFSSPSLPQHRKHKRRKIPAAAPRPHQMEWCPLASTGSRAELLLPFTGKQSQYPPGFLGGSSLTKASKSKRTGNVQEAGPRGHPLEQGAYPLPVVSPSLGAGGSHAAKAAGQQPHVKQKRVSSLPV